MSTILTHGVALVQIYNASLKCAALGLLEMKNPKSRQKFAIAHRRTTLSGCIFTTKACINNRKKLVKQLYLLHMSSQYGELLPTFGSDRLAPQQMSSGCASSLLQRRRSTEANQTLHDVWPSPGLVHYIYIFDSSCPVTEFCHVQNSLCAQVLHSPILAALLHGTPAAGISQTLRC